MFCVNTFTMVGKNFTSHFTYEMTCEIFAF